MIRHAVCTLAPALFLTAGFLANPAAAQNAAPALRANVTVTADIVRIGDLVEHAGAVADVPIFRAPDLGTRGSVPIERVVEAIRPHQLIGIDTRGISEVVVTRASRAIPAQEISAAIAKALESQYGLGEARNISVEFDRDARTLNVEPSRPAVTRRRPDEANAGTAQRHRDDLLRSARHSADATRTGPGCRRAGRHHQRHEHTIETRGASRRRRSRSRRRGRRAGARGRKRSGLGAARLTLLRDTAT
jgi:hypothetical protein